LILTTAPTPFAGEIEFACFDKLSTRQFHDILKLRFDVFVLEQKSIYPEIDGDDPNALHCIATSGDVICGTLRILGLHLPSGPTKIGRVAVNPNHRGSGLGRKMMQAALNHIDQVAPDRMVTLGAQCQLEGFYASLGFQRCSEIYDDGGIDHIDMARAPVKQAP